MSDFLFTSENLIENIEKLGPWSAYGLASSALMHYFPDAYDEDGNCKEGTIMEVELCYKLGCAYWQDVIIKFQNEVGYNAPDGFNPDAVNER